MENSPLSQPCAYGEGAFDGTRSLPLPIPSNLNILELSPTRGVHIRVGVKSKLKRVMSSDRISGYILNRSKDYLRAPFILALLACAAACGGAFAQSAPRDVSHQTSQSDSTTQGAEFRPAQLGERRYVGVYLGDVNAER